MKDKLVGLLLLYFLLLFTSAAKAEVYVTLKGFEPDKLASIWLIKRFIDQKAEFVFLTKGDFPQEGIAFDVPDARLRRSHTRSTFETILHACDRLHAGYRI